MEGSARFLGLALSAAILISVFAAACSMTAPYIRLEDGNKSCLLYPDWYRRLNITSLDENNLHTICPEFSLTLEDREIIANAFNKRKSDYRYTHIKKQSDEEYEALRKKMEEVNSDVCDCSKIVLHERRGGWTVYTNTFKKSCSFSTACYQPPFYCPNSVYFKSAVFKLSVGIVLISVLAGILITGKKRRGKQ